MREPLLLPPEDFFFEDFLLTLPLLARRFAFAAFLAALGSRAN
jgi:hypothetical protein